MSREASEYFKVRKLANRLYFEVFWIPCTAQIIYCSLGNSFNYATFFLSVLQEFWTWSGQGPIRGTFRSLRGESDGLSKYSCWEEGKELIKTTNMHFFIFNVKSTWTGEFIVEQSEMMMMMKELTTCSNDPSSSLFSNKKLQDLKQALPEKSASSILMQLDPWISPFRSLHKWLICKHVLSWSEDIYNKWKNTTARRFVRAY